MDDKTPEEQARAYLLEWGGIVDEAFVAPLALAIEHNDQRNINWAKNVATANAEKERKVAALRSTESFDLEQWMILSQKCKDIAEGQPIEITDAEKDALCRFNELDIERKQRADDLRSARNAIREECAQIVERTDMIGPDQNGNVLDNRSRKTPERAAAAIRATMESSEA